MDDEFRNSNQKISALYSNNSKDKDKYNNINKDNKVINAPNENININLSKPIQENDPGINTPIIPPSINPEINTLINTGEILLAKEKVNDSISNNDNINNLVNDNK